MAFRSFVASLCLLASLAVCASAQNFAPVTPINPVPAWPNFTLLADFNNDGRADLLTVGYPNGNSSSGVRMSIYAGNGDGTFTALPVTFVTVDQCGSPRDVRVDGLDQTHSLNILLLCGDTLQLWHAAYDGGKGTVSLDPGAQNRQVINLALNGNAMAIGDFTASGGPGVAVLTTNGVQAVVTVYPQVQCGANCVIQASFIPLSGLPVTYDITSVIAGGYFPTALTAATVQGSAAQAVVVAAAATATTGGGRIIPLLYNTTTNVLEAKATANIPGPYSPYAIADADFDRNGTDDLVLAGTNSDTSNAGFLIAFKGAGDGTFTAFRTGVKGAAVITPFGPQVNAPVGLAIADLNGDGFPDIVSGGPQPIGFTGASDTTYITPSNGDGTFSGSLVSVSTLDKGSHDVGGGVAAVSIGQIDTDGAPDFLAQDIIGVYDSSSFSTGNFQPYAGANLQSFVGAGRQFKSSVSLQAASTSTGAVLTATTGSSQQSGFIQIFDATYQKYIGSAPLSGGTAAFTVSGIGSHFFIAYYYGNSDYFGSASNSMQIGLSVTPIATTTAILVSAYNPYQGTAVSFNATVTPASGTNPATGVVTFSDGVTVLGTGTLDITGKATYSTSGLSIGTHAVVAIYAGGGNFSASASTSTTVIVKAPSTTTTVLSSTSLTPAPSTSITLTAKITGTDSGTPTGTVTFKDGATTLGTGTLAAGTATFATSTLSTASHILTAVYSGDSTFATSTSAAITITVTLPQSTTTTTLSANTTTPASGASVTLTAAVTSTATGTPSGTVTFKDGAITLGTGTLAAGSATFTTTTLSTGAHAITAVYAGDTAFLASTSSTLTVTVAALIPSDFTITVNPGSLSIARGQSGSATFTVTPTGGFLGAITFSCTGLPSGTACTFAPPSVTADGTNKVLTSTLTLTTTSSTSNSRSSTGVSFMGSNGLLGLLPAFGCGLLLTFRRRKFPLGSLLLALISFIAAAGISGCSNGAPVNATPVGSYSVSVAAGVTGSTSHTAALSVTITQ